MAKIVFFGSPAVAADTLQTLISAGHQVELVVTQPDKRRGRRSGAEPTPVGKVARENDIAVSHNPADSIDVKADYSVVAAYGALLKDEVLDARPPLNVHFSLLPRWRGAAPVERAILAGDRKIGVSIMKVVKELDAGPVYAVDEMELDSTSTATELIEKLGVMGSSLLLELFANGLGEPVEQTGEPTYAEKLTHEEFRLRPTDSVELALAKVRCERAYISFSGKTMAIESAVSSSESVPPGSIKDALVGLSNGAIEMTHVKPSGSRSIDAKSWLNGAHLTGGETFE